MVGIWVALAVGAVLGGAVGWRAGRLHMHAGQRYEEWRDTAHGLPIVRRSALEAIRDVAVYIGGAVLVVLILVAMVWASA